MGRRCRAGAALVSVSGSSRRNLEPEAAELEEVERLANLLAEALLEHSAQPFPLWDLADAGFPDGRTVDSKHLWDVVVERKEALVAALRSSSPLPHPLPPRAASVAKWIVQLDDCFKMGAALVPVDYMTGLYQPLFEDPSGQRGLQALQAFGITPRGDKGAGTCEGELYGVYRLAEDIVRAPETYRAAKTNYARKVVREEAQREIRDYHAIPHDNRLGLTPKESHYLPDEERRRLNLDALSPEDAARKPDSSDVERLAIERDLERVVAATIAAEAAAWSETEQLYALARAKGLAPRDARQAAGIDAVAAKRVDARLKRSPKLAALRTELRS